MTFKGIHLQLAYCLILAFMFSVEGKAQNVSVFTLENQSIKHVKFEARQVSKIYIETVSNTRFKFQSSSESTYKNELYFDYNVKNDSLIITDIYPKQLEFGNNKMTSTQVFSVEVWLTMPKDLSLLVDSEYASIKAKGQFKDLFLNTKSGSCNLTISNTNANVSTFSGNIIVKTLDASVDAETQNGKLNIDRFILQKYQMRLKSIDGDITVESREL